MGQPSPPSPGTIASEATGLSNEQQGYNIGAQAGSQYNQSDPYGSLNYSQTGVGPGGVPLYSATTSFSPAQQNLYNQYTGTQAQAGANAATDLGFGNYGTVSPSQQIGSATSGTTGQLENMYLGSVEPFFQTQQQQLDTQLQNQGFTANSPSGGTNNPNGPTAQGNPAYNNAMRQLTTNQDQAALGAAAQFEPSAFSQATSLYNLPLTTSEQLAQWGAPTSPTSQFTSNTPALSAPNAIGADQAVGSQAEAQYQAQQAQYNAMISGLFGVGSAALGGLTGGLGLGGLGLGYSTAGGAGALPPGLGGPIVSAND
jgi:hypothetical protein